MESDSTVANLRHLPHLRGRVIVGAGMRVPERWLRGVTFVRPDGRGNKNLDTAYRRRQSAI